MADEKRPNDATRLDQTPRHSETGVSLLSSTNAERFAGITCIPGVCGGDPCIEGTRMAVWILYQAKLKGVSDGDLLKRHPFLSRRNLENAWAFTKEHLAEIEESIRDNNVW
jgi:uncharacterized protein (DUF433 family)